MQKQFLGSLLTLVLLFGCSTPKSAMDNLSAGNEQIPTSFNPNKSILLIEQAIDDDKSEVSTSNSNSLQTDDYMNHYMKKNKKNMIEFADKNYQFKHEFVTQTDIYESTSKYSDKKLYRFAVVTSLIKPNQRYVVNSSNGSMQSTHNQPIFRFYLYDRLDDKTYSALSNGSSLVMWAFKSAIKKLSADK